MTVALNFSLAAVNDLEASVDATTGDVVLTRTPAPGSVVGTEEIRTSLKRDPSGELAQPIDSDAGGAFRNVQDGAPLYTQLREKDANGKRGPWSNVSIVTMPAGPGGTTFSVKFVRPVVRSDSGVRNLTVSADAEINAGGVITYLFDMDYNGDNPAAGEVFEFYLQGQPAPLPSGTFIGPEGPGIGDAIRAAIPNNTGFQSFGTQLGIRAFLDTAVWPFTMQRRTADLQAGQGDKITSIGPINPSSGIAGPPAPTIIRDTTPAPPTNPVFNQQTVLDDIALGGLVGEAGVDPPTEGVVYSLTVNPGNLFAFVGSQLRTAAALTAGAHVFTWRATRGSQHVDHQDTVDVGAATPPFTVFDFANGTLPDGVSISCPDPRYRNKSDRTLELIGPNLPRFQYDAKTGVYQGLMIGRSYQQLVVKSETITTWSRTGIYAAGAGSVANDPTQTDPLGGHGFSLMKEDTSTGLHQFSTTIPANYINRYLRVPFRVRLPASNGVKKFYIQVSNSSDYIGAYVDLDANGGAGGIYDGPTANSGGQGLFRGADIYQLPDGTYEASLRGRAKGASASSCTIVIRFLEPTSSASSYTGTDRSLYVWGVNAYAAPVTDTVNTSIASGSIEQRYPFGAPNTTTAAELFDNGGLPFPGPGIYDIRIVTPNGVFVQRSVVVAGNTWQMEWPVEAWAEESVLEIRAALAPYYENDIDIGNVPPFFTLPDITTIGGDDAVGASRVEVTDFSTKTAYVNAIKNTARPAHVKLTGSGVAPTVGETGLQFVNGRITVEGDPELVLGEGAPWQFGTSATQVQDVKLLNINFIAGLRLGKPTGPNSAGTTNTTPPLYGATMPVGGWGNSLDSRDGAQLEAVLRFLAQQMLIAGALDEGTEMWGSSAQKGLQDILWLNSIWTYQLNNPLDALGKKYNSQAPHSKNVLVGYRSKAGVWLVRNICIDTSIIAASNDRNPQVMSTEGFQCINSLLTGFGAKKGMAIVQHDHDTSVKDGSTVAFAGNLIHYPAGGVTDPRAIGAIFMQNIDRGSAAWFGDPADPTTWNWVTDGRNFNLDVPIHWRDGISLQDGSTQRSIKRFKHFSSPRPIRDLSTAAKREEQWNRLVGEFDSVTGTRSKDINGNFIPGDAGASSFVRATHQAIRAGTIHVINYPSEFPWAA